jgi:hypothetical protein
MGSPSFLFPEAVYALHEAVHILHCSAFFMRKLSEVCDENGNASTSPTLPGLEGA